MMDPSAAACLTRADLKATRPWLRRLRREIVRLSPGWIKALADYRKVTEAEALASEILPLADAVHFLQSQAVRLLKPRRVSSAGRPLWMFDTVLESHCQPRGKVLVIGPGNYPLLLSAVPALQALVAGNQVLLKPAPGTTALLEFFGQALQQAGGPSARLKLLPERVEAVYATIAQGIDLAVFTGSAEHGRALLSKLAQPLVPAIVELSGCDSAFVLEDADLKLAARSIAYGLRLNHGRTCIAPRRLLVAKAVAPPFRKALLKELSHLEPTLPLPRQTASLVDELVQEALKAGAHIAHGQPPSPDQPFTPLLLDNVRTDLRCWRSDIFAPMASLLEFESLEEALAADQACPYQLGASIFGKHQQQVSALAQALRAPNVTINDLIVPTADPRLSFGGTGHSGYGHTRGPEGLRAMIIDKTIARKRTPLRPHLEPPSEQQHQLLAKLLHWLHGR